MAEIEVTQRQPTYRIWDGVIGGIIGGVLMGMGSMILFPVLWIGGFWQPMNLIGGLFNQEWGLIAGFALVPSLLGMMIHLIMSAGMGALFAWTSRQMRSAGTLILTAILMSLLVWVVADYLVLPFINPVMTVVFPDWLFAGVHVLFGLGLGGYLAWRRRQTEETVHTTETTTVTTVEPVTETTYTDQPRRVA